MHRPEPAAIRALHRFEVPAATDVLGRAFGDNPGYQAIFAALSEADRHAAVASMKRGFVEAAVRYQHVDCIDHEGALAAVSLWCAPDEYPVSLAAKVWHARGALTLGVRSIANLLRMDFALAKHHISERHYYLWVLGVDPASQGRGYGSRMLHHLNAIGDRDGLPWYLETDKPTSVRLYERHGYEVLSEFRVPSVGNVTMWSMRRMPR